jgi:creatinine deaminase
MIITELEMKIGVQSAYTQALKSFDEGGVPVGSSLLFDGTIVALGHNQRVQKGSNILHGETDCIENAGHLIDFSKSVLFTTLSPCLMCSSTILLFHIPHVVILDNKNTNDYETSVDTLKKKGVEVTVIDHAPSIKLNYEFQKNPKTRGIWLGDVGI